MYYSHRRGSDHLYVWWRDAQRRLAEEEIVE